MFEDLDITECFLKGAELLSEFSEMIHKLVFRKNSLVESTFYGKRYLLQIRSISEELFKLNNTLQYRIDHNEKPKFYEMKELIDDLNEREFPNVYYMIKRVFEKDTPYDDEDRAGVHKACQAFKYLSDQYHHKYHQIQLKYSEFRSLQMNTFQMTIHKKYEAPESLVQEFLRGVEDDIQTKRKTTVQ